MSNKSRMTTKNSNTRSLSKPREVPVATAAAILFGGDEAQVWASVASGVLQATVLIEPSGGAEFSEPLSADRARKFMSGATEHMETRDLPAAPIPMGLGFLKAPFSHNVQCISRRSSVLVTINDEAEALTANTWPWGAHDTKLLRALAAAAGKFWTNYDPADPTTAETSETVSTWLQDEHNVSVRVAEVIAQILRADGLPTGPRK